MQIKNFLLERSDSDIRLVCPLLSGGGVLTKLWFEFSSEFENNIVTDRIDGIVVMCLQHFMLLGEDIKSDIPMSEKLHYQLTQELIPTLNAASNGKLKIIKIICPLTTEIISGESIATTGISCGVDSFCAIYKHLDCEESYRVKLLAYFNNGAFNGNYKFSEQQIRDCFYQSAKKSKQFAIENGFQFLLVDSNINTILSTRYSVDHTFRTAGMAMLFQGYIGKYYYAGGFAIQHNHFIVDTESDSAYYDILTLPLISNESITFYSQGISLKRIDKVKLISDYEPTRAYLQVCVRDTDNCSVCEKCGRTLLALEGLNQLHRYAAVFDIEKYKTNRTKIMARMLSNLRTDPFSKDNYDLLKKKKVRIPLISYLLAPVYSIKRNARTFLMGIIPRKVKERIKAICRK